MVELNDAGRMIERWWKELPNKFQHVGLDEYIVMPDHFHGIVIIHSVGQTGVSAPLRLTRVGAHTQVRPNVRQFRESYSGGKP